jgi:hypothetical protein
MDSLLQPASATAFDAVAATVSLLAYLSVGIVVLARSPRDVRAHVFMIVAAAGVLPYALSPLQWWKGNAVYTPALIAATAVSFSIGSAALFHFTQVFPAKRPWIRGHRGWLVAAYIVPALPVAAIAWLIGGLTAQVAVLDTTGSGGFGAVADPGTIAVEMLLALPLVFLVGVVLPFSAVMSLFNSWKEAKNTADERARSATFWMLLSQMGGGVLSVLVLPMLHLIGVAALWGTAIAALAYGFTLLFPAAFAWAVFKGAALSTST